MDQQANSTRMNIKRSGQGSDTGLRLVEGPIVIDPSSEAGIGDLRSLPAGLHKGELHRLLAEWNDTPAEFPRESCIHQMFEEQTARTPDAPAVVFEGTTLPYAELNRRANQLAHHLIGLGVKPDSRVAICMERSTEMVVGLLAILKSGGAYVPLDPGYPVDRLRYMLEDSAPVALLTQTSLLGLLETRDASLPLVDLTESSAPWKGQPESNPDRAVLRLSSTNLAYIIYTSGSTGKPKGVMIEHRSLVNRLVWMQESYGLTAADAVLQKTPFSFDVSVWEFFWPLLFGARLVMARPEGHKDPMYLGEAIEKNKITTLHFVPSMLQVFVGQAKPEQCASLVRVFSSGEALPAALVRKFYNQLPDATLYNLYGPTEATVDVTAWTCRPESMLTTVPIGKPIANTQAYILDEQREPVPVGEEGELYLGGVQVARGYLNRPELTAERFVTDPFAKVPGARMYRTGDLCRWRADGNIEYLGRNDFQVKIRGFRIELGEIEARLAEHPEVREAVVIAREDHSGDKRLVAYIVPASGANLGESALREVLGRQLPDYMVPSSFVSLPAMPVTANGKLDRAALPAPSASNQLRREASAASRKTLFKIKSSRSGSARLADEMRRGTAYAPPTDTLEMELIEIWEEILGLEHIGIRDDFFQLGGHSLLAARMFARIAEKLEKNLPFATLFKGATIEKLAEVIRAEGWTSHWSVLVPIQEHGSKPPLFLVHGLHGNVVNFYGFRQHIPTDQPLYGVQANGLDSGRAAFVNIPDMAAHYVAEIRALQPEGPYFLGGFSAGGLVAYEMARQLQQAGERVQFLALVDSYVEAAGGYWMKALYSRRAMRMSLLALRVSWQSIWEEGLIPVFRKKVRNMTVNLRIMAWLLMGKLVGSRDGNQPQARFLSPHEAFTQAIRVYTPQPYSGSAVSFRSPSTNFEDQDASDGWERYISGKVEHQEIYGGHDDIFLEPHVATLAAQLMDALEETYREQEEEMDKYLPAPMNRS
jgi:amino acid adenylation domain-containing protein